MKQHTSDGKRKESEKHSINEEEEEEDVEKTHNKTCA